MSAASTSEIADLLRRVPMYRRLAPEDCQHLAQVSRLAYFAKGDGIFAEADPPASFFTVVSGRVKVWKSTPSGKDVILEIFAAGDPLGAIAIFEGRPYPASAIALEDTVCVVTPREAFLRLLESHPSLVRGLLSGLTLRLVDLTTRLAEMTGGRIESRFARLFVKLAREVGQRRPDGIFIAMALTRHELADLTGTTTETAIRIMSRWGKEGLVLTEQGGFCVHDLAALEALAGS